MASSYTWNFTESATGVNPDPQSFENTNNLIFNRVNDNNRLIGFDNGGYTITKYSDIGVLDLNTVHSPDSSFTIEFSLKENVYIDTSKAINYLTFGYHIRGRSGVTITVGREAGSKFVVVGTITEKGTDKASTISTVKFETLPDEVYDYTLYYNHFGTDDEKLKLFRGYDLIASSTSMNIRTLSIIDRKLFIGSSGWVNETSWNGSFDVANNITFIGQLNFITNKAIDKGFLPGTPMYPVHVSLSNITNTGRNDLHLATNNDTLELKFHCLKDVSYNSVVAIIDNKSNNIIQHYVDTNYPSKDEDGNDILTNLYTYRFPVENDWPFDGSFSYGLDVDGSITLSNIIPPVTNFYIDNTTANVNFTLGPPTGSTIDTILHASSPLVDNYLSDMSATYDNYSISFYASNTDHVLSTTINNLNITNNGTYTISSLDSESFYNIYATVTDPFGNTSDRILPSSGGTNIIETNDITRPNFELDQIPTNIFSIQLDTSKKPGVQLNYFSWDTAAELGHKYRTYISLTTYADLNDYDYIVTNNHFQHYEERENYEKPIAPYEVVFTQAYNSIGTLEDIVQETIYYIYVFIEDDAGNIHNESYTHNIINNLTFTSIVSDFTTDTNVAKQGNNIILSFTTDYNISNSYLNVTIIGESIVPTSINGLDWTATKLITSSDNSGGATYSVNQSLDISPISSFNETSHALYIQTVNPSIKPGITFTSNLTDFRVNNITDFIDDYTINSNNNLVSLEFTINSQKTTFNYTNKSELESVYIFPNLEENKLYNIDVSLSNVFSKSTDIRLGSLTTLLDVPLMTLDTTIIDITDASYPLVQISNNSKVTEHTTPFNLHIYLTDFNILDTSSIKVFMQSTVPQVTNSPIGENIDINTLFSSDITTFLSGSSSSYIQEQIIPSTTTEYYLYGLIDDTRSDTVYIKKTITLNFSITQAVLNNTSYTYFVRNDDVVEMTWTTTYVSQASDFTNIKIYGVNAILTSSDGLNWTAQATIVSGTATHSLSYLGNPINVNHSNVFYDNNAPSFTISLITTSTNAFVVNLNNFGSDTYTNQSVPSGVNTDYSINFIITKEADNSITNYPFTIDYNNLISNNYTLNGLEEAKDYFISAKLIDPANNEINILYNLGFSLQTSDITIPIINSLSSIITVKELNKIPGFTIDTNTIDNNDYNLYLSIFNYELTGSEDSKKLAIINNHFTNDNISIINTNVDTSTDLYKYYKDSDSTQYDILTEETYYIYCLAIDINDNFVISNNLKTIDNTFSNTSIVTNFTKNDVAEIDNIITISFTTDYRVLPLQLHVIMMGDTVVPVSSDNGITWTVTNTVTSVHSSGKIIFSVSQSPDIGISTSSFDDTTLNSVFIQKEKPALLNIPTIEIGAATHNIHNIVVTINAGKYLFTPSISSLTRGHTYIFDNTDVNSVHPLRFTNSGSINPGLNSNTILFKDDINHIIVITVTDNMNTPLFAHCGIHSDMGSNVNSETGLSIVEQDNGINFISTTNQVVIKNINTNIHDYTINSNNDLVKLTLQVGDQTITNIYDSLTDMPTSFIFDNLTENNTYNITASLSNLFSESNNISLGVVGTAFDFPIITLDASIDNIANEPFVKMLSSSKVTEKTTAFDIYIEITDFEFTNSTELSDFITNTSGINPKKTNISVGEDIDYISLLSSQNINNYWSRSSGSFINKPLIPSTTSEYYIYAFVDDHNTLLKTSVALDFNNFGEITNASLSNLTNPYLVRTGDTVRMTWTTLYKSQISDFTNVSIYDIDATSSISSSDQINWQTEIVVLDSVSSLNEDTGQNILYLENSVINFDYTNTLLYNQDHTFDIYIINKTIDSFSIKLINFSDPPNLLSPPITLLPYTVQFTIININDDSTIVYDIESFTDINNIHNTTFNLDNLSEYTPYTISCTLIDPAQKSVTVNYNTGNVVRTIETNSPVLINDSIIIDVEQGELSVSFSNVTAYDTQSVFDVFVGLASINDMTNLSTNALSNLQNTDAVVSFSNNNSSSTPISFNSNLTKVLVNNGTTWSSSTLDFDTEYFIIIASKDIFGNVAHANAVVFGNITIPPLPSDEFLDNTIVEITPEDTADAGQVNITNSDLNLTFKNIVNSITTYSASNYSGGNIIEASESPFVVNPATNIVSLNMGLADNGIPIPISNIVDSETFSYSLNVINTNSNSLNTSTTLFEDVGNNVDMTLNTITSFVGQDTDGTNYIDIDTSINPLFVQPIYIAQTIEGDNTVVIEAVTNPIIINTVDNTSSLNLGLTTSGLTIHSDNIPETNTFTYSIDVSSTKNTFGSETIILQDISNNVHVTMSDSELIIKTNENHIIIFPIATTLDRTNINNITISQDIDQYGNVTLNAHNNGNELSASSSSGVPTFINQSQNILNIPSQLNIIVNNIVLYDTIETSNVASSLNNITFGVTEEISLNMALIDEFIIIPTTEVSGDNTFTLSINILDTNSSYTNTSMTLFENINNNVEMSLNTTNTFIAQSTQGTNTVVIEALTNPIIIDTINNTKSLDLGLTTYGFVIPTNNVPNTDIFSYSINVSSTENTFGDNNQSTIILEDTNNNIEIRLSDNQLVVQTNENHSITYQVATTINNNINNITISQEVTENGSIIIKAHNNGHELSTSSSSGIPSVINNSTFVLAIPTQPNIIINNIVLYDTIETSNVIVSPNTIIFDVQQESEITVITSADHVSTFTTSLDIYNINNITLSHHVNETNDVILNLNTNGLQIEQTSIIGTPNIISHATGELTIPVQSNLSINEIAFYHTVETSNVDTTTNMFTFLSEVDSTITVNTNNSHAVTYTAPIISSNLNNITFTQSLNDSGEVEVNVFTNGDVLTVLNETGTPSQINNIDTNLIIPRQSNVFINDIVFYDTVESSNVTPSLNNFQFIETIQNTTTYIGSDASGNGNNINVIASENPLNYDAITGEFSLDVGLIEQPIVIPITTAVQQSSNLTYSINIKKTDGSFGKTVLFEQADLDVELYITDNEIVFQTGVDNIMTMPVNLTSDMWNNISLSQQTLQDGTVVINVFANGEQLFTSGNQGTITAIDTSIPMTVPPEQTDLLIDSIILFDTPATDNIIKSLANSSSFKIKLDFEDAYITNYNVSLSNNKFYFYEGYEGTGLLLNSNVAYTFSQNDFEQPLLFSTAGQFPISDTDTLDVTYYLNNALIGNDPTRYAQEYYTSIDNKVVVRPNSSSNSLYYHTTSSSLATTTRVTIKDEDARIRNKATINSSAQPTYIMTPQFTTDTLSGNYAMNFSSSNQDFLSFNNFNIDANEMTITMWVKPSESNIPLLSQQGIFDIGINSDGQLYFDLLANDTFTPFMTNIDTTTSILSESGISLIDIELSTPISDPTYVFAMASVENYDKITAIETMDILRDTENVVFKTFDTNSSSNLSIPFNTVLNSDKTTNTNVSLIDKAYVYLQIREDSNNFILGAGNQYDKYKVTYLEKIPRIIIDSMTPVLNNTMTIGGKIRFTYRNISTVKIAIFKESVDLTNEENVKTFINTNGIELSELTFPLTDKNIVINFNQAINTVFSSISSTLTETLTNSDVYHVCMIIVDTNITKLIKKTNYPLRSYTEDETDIEYTGIPSNTIQRVIAGPFARHIMSSDDYVFFPWIDIIKFVPFDYNDLPNNEQFTHSNTLQFFHSSNNIINFCVSPDNYMMFYVKDTSELYILNTLDIQNYCTSNSVTTCDISTLTSTELPTLFKTTVTYRNTDHWQSTSFNRSNRMTINNNFAIIVDDVVDDTKMYIYFRTSDSNWDLIQTINYTESHLKLSGCVQVTNTHLAFSVELTGSSFKTIIYKINGITFEYSQDIDGYSVNSFAMNDKYLIVGSDSTGSKLNLYLLENDNWVYKNQASVNTNFRGYQNQGVKSYNNLSLYGNRVVICSVYNSNNAMGGVVTYHINETDGITYKHELPGNPGYLPSFNGNQQYKYYGSTADLHKHVLFIHGDGNNTYAYWS